MITSTAIDDDWSAGYAGLHRGVQTAAAEQFDDFKAGYDTNADGDIADAGERAIDLGETLESDTAARG